MSGPSDISRLDLLSSSYVHYSGSNTSSSEHISDGRGNRNTENVSDKRDINGDSGNLALSFEDFFQFDSDTSAAAAAAAPRKVAPLSPKNRRKAQARVAQKTHHIGASGSEKTEREKIKNQLFAWQLPPALYKIYTESGSDFELLAKNPKLLSQFLCGLLKLDNELFMMFLQSFKEDQYNTPVHLVVDDTCDNDVIPYVEEIAKKFPCITSLHVEHKEVQRVHLVQLLQATSSVQEVTIAKCSNLKKSSFVKIVFPVTVRKMTMDDVPLSDKGLRALVQRNGAHLESLSIQNCERITFEGLDDIPALPTVTEFKAINLNISDKGFATIARIFTCARTLWLPGAFMITPNGFTNITLTRSITSLALHQCAVTDATLAALLAPLSHLRELSLAGCSKITQSAYQTLTLPESLEVLILNETNIDKLGLVHIFQQCPYLQLVELVSCLGIESADFHDMPYPRALLELNCEKTKIDFTGLKQLFRICGILKSASFVACLHVPALCQKEELRREDFEMTLNAIEEFEQRRASSATDALEQAIDNIEID